MPIVKELMNSSIGTSANLYGIRKSPKIRPAKRERQFLKILPCGGASRLNPKSRRIIAGIEKYSKVDSEKISTPLTNEARMLTPIERTPAPVKSCSALTAQKQKAPATTQRKPHRSPTGNTQNVSVASETPSCPRNMPKAILERYAHDEKLDHALSGTM